MAGQERDRTVLACPSSNRAHRLRGRGLSPPAPRALRRRPGVLLLDVAADEGAGEAFDFWGHIMTLGFKPHQPQRLPVELPQLGHAALVHRERRAPLRETADHLPADEAVALQVLEGRARLTVGQPSPLEVGHPNHGPAEDVGAEVGGHGVLQSGKGISELRSHQR